MAEDFVFIKFGEKKGSFHCSLQVPEEGKWREKFWSLLGSSDRTHRSGLNMLQRRLGLDVRKHFFEEWVFKPWNRLPRQLVNAASLSVFKRYLDEALNSIL